MTKAQCRALALKVVLKLRAPGCGSSLDREDFTFCEVCGKVTDRAWACDGKGFTCYNTLWKRRGTIDWPYGVRFSLTRAELKTLRAGKELGAVNWGETRDD